MNVGDKSLWVVGRANTSPQRKFSMIYRLRTDSGFSGDFSVRFRIPRGPFEPTLFLPTLMSYQPQTLINFNRSTKAMGITVVCSRKSQHTYRCSGHLPFTLFDAAVRSS